MEKISNYFLPKCTKVLKKVSFESFKLVLTLIKAITISVNSDTNENINDSSFEK
jgi:hypothetical protein